MLRILIGLVILAVGIFIVIKTESMLSAFGRIYFFEKHFGSDGGSRLGYKLIGLLFTFIGILVITNLINNFMYWVLGPLLRLGNGGV
jgi:hypothetical protein